MNVKAQPVHTQLVSEKVVEALAKYYGVDPIDLSPLYHGIDPEALDNLFAPRSNGESRHKGSVSFTYQDLIVKMDSEGDITIRPAAEPERGQSD